MKRFNCAVCHGEESRDEVVDDVFCIDGKYILVCDIPATLCARCGEQSFSPESAEKVRLMVQGNAKATKSVSMQVYNFAG